MGMVALLYPVLPLYPLLPVRFWMEAATPQPLHDVIDKRFDDTYSVFEELPL
jgi:hypothetical protein